MNKNVKSFFSGWLEPKEETPVNETEQAGELDEQSSSSLSVTAKTSFSIAGQVSQPDPAYLEVVMRELEDANIAGVDYFELREAAATLASSEGISVEKALQNAFSTLRTVDKTLTVEKVISSSGHYIRVVSEIKDRFFQDSNEQIRLREQQLGTFRKDFEDLVKTLNDKELENKFSSSSNGILEESFLSTKQKEEMRQAKMALVCDNVVSEITNDQTLITRVLQGGDK